MSLFPPYVNKELFAEHYLTSRLPKRPEWEQARVDAAPVLAELRRLWSIERARLPGYNEEQLRKHWIDRVFELMGATVDPEPSLPTDDARVTLHPDYVLFADASARAEAQTRREARETSAYFRAAQFIGDAKSWGTSFTKPVSGKTPRQQLTEYLHVSLLDWGFLTDGQKWRLTHRTVAGRLDQYFEIDLPACLESHDDEHFLYFFAFFGPAGWRRDDKGRCLLDRIREGSESYAREVGEDLKESVYEALEVLARGFIQRGSVAPLKELRDECLTLLYRLLFLFYAEDRELLPVKDLEYLPYSLRSLATDVAKHLDAGRSYSSKRQGLWCRLTDQFNLVDKGDSDLGIPPYNGGLFNPRYHALLATGNPGDFQLAHAVDLLARTRAQRGQRERIDYSALSIRHLGTIYEGLLEYELKTADVDRAIVTENGRLKTIPYDPGKHSELPEDRRIARGEVYCVTGNEERHATGSFYTPDYIVEHVVKQALGDRVAGRTPEEILKLRVVDTAMGSGHFLLEAIDFLGRAWCAAHGEDAETTEDDLAQAKRLVAEHCIYGVDLNPMAVELAKLALWLATMAKDRPLTFLNLHLQAGNSLLGVRIDDVGKLPAARKGKRKKKNGNGEQADLPLFAQKLKSRLPAMLQDVFKILAQETRTKADVEQKEAWERAIDGIRNPFRDVADVQALLLLSSIMDEVDARVEQVRPAAKVADEEKERAQNLRLELGHLVNLIERPGELFAHPLVKLARDERGKAGFFHWELMFPEVFFDSFGRRLDDAGFDVVIGNPPWIRQEIVGGDKDAFEALYPPVFDSIADIYVFFIALGQRLAKSDGAVTLVLPNKWLKAEYAGKLRQFLIGECTPTQLTDFGHAPVFPEADTFPSILSFHPQRREDAGDFRYAPLKREDIQEDMNLGAVVAQRSFVVSRDQLRPDGWYPVPPELAALLRKISKAGNPLEQVTGTIRRGLITGLNDAFFVDTRIRDRLAAGDSKTGALFKKLIRGADVDRWSPVWRDHWLLQIASSENEQWPWANAPSDSAAEKIFKKTYPSVHGHLKKVEKELRARQDQGRFWWELRSCDYYAEFERPKIVYPEIMFHSTFGLDDGGHVLNNKSYMVQASVPGLLSCLNSSLLWLYMTFTLPHMKDEALSPAAFLMKDLPIVPVGDHEGELIEGTRRRRRIAAQFLDWLRLEMELPKVTQKLQSFWRLSDKGLSAELKKGGLKTTSASLARVRDEFVPAKRECLDLLGRIRDLERQTQALVYEAYGLTPEEIALVEQTAPPRDPMKVLDQELTPFED